LEPSVEPSSFKKTHKHLPLEETSTFGQPTSALSQNPVVGAVLAPEQVPEQVPSTLLELVGHVSALGLSMDSYEGGKESLVPGQRTCRAQTT
jgi:hypothetical protein